MRRAMSKYKLEYTFFAYNINLILYCKNIKYYKNERIYYQKGFVEIFNELLTEEEKNYIRNINTKNLP